MSAYALARQQGQLIDDVSVEILSSNRLRLLIESSQPPSVGIKPFVVPNKSTVFVLHRSVRDRSEPSRWPVGLDRQARVALAQLDSEG